MELVLGKELCEMNLDETMLINGGLTTADVAEVFVGVAATVVGTVVGGAVGAAIGGPIGAAIGGKNGAKVGALIGGIVVGYIAEEATTNLIDGMAKN